ncbi:hypothetical protein [Rhizobium phage RHEph12]|nr:hypothetical protein [Rhizobium phage RHEph12]
MPYAVITYYHPHEGHAVINDVISPFKSIDEAFGYIKDHYDLHNKNHMRVNFRAYSNVDFQISTKAEIYTRDRIGHVRIQPVRYPDEDFVKQRVDELATSVKALAEMSEEIVTHGRAVYEDLRASRMLSPEAVSKMLESISLKTVPLRLLLTKQFEQLKQEIGK